MKISSFRQSKRACWKDEIVLETINLTAGQSVQKVESFAVSVNKPTLLEMVVYMIN